MDPANKIHVEESLNRLVQRHYLSSLSLHALVSEVKISGLKISLIAQEIVTQIATTGHNSCSDVSHS